MDITMEKLGEKISKLRDDRGWTQEDLSKYSKVTRRTIQNIEGGKVQSPGLDMIYALAKALGVSLTYLVEGDITRAELILDIQQSLYELEFEDLETIQTSAKNLVEIAKQKRLIAASNAE